MQDLFRRRAERSLGGRGGPTSDLYFLNACDGCVADGQVRRLSQTVFASQEALLVMRHGAGVDLAPLLPGRRLIWLIDDDVISGAHDPHIAPVQRLKLRLCEGAFFRTYRERMDAIVVSSRSLVERWSDLVPAAEIHCIDPFWREPFADLGHFDDLSSIEVGCLVAATHRRDMDLVWPALETVLKEVPRARVTISSNHRPPRGMRGHPRLAFVAARSWPDYRRWMTRQRFHVLAYPLLDTAFNRARSANKLVEHAVLGAAGIYPRLWAMSARILDADAGRLCDAEAQDWTRAMTTIVRDLCTDPGSMRSMAEAGQRLARQINRPEMQRGLWSRLMGLHALSA